MSCEREEESGVQTRATRGGARGCRGASSPLWLAVLQSALPCRCAPLLCSAPLCCDFGLCSHFDLSLDDGVHTAHARRCAGARSRCFTLASSLLTQTLRRAPWLSRALPYLPYHPSPHAPKLKQLVAAISTQHRGKFAFASSWEPEFLASIASFGFLPMAHRLDDFQGGRDATRAYDERGEGPCPYFLMPKLHTKRCLLRLGAAVGWVLGVWGVGVGCVWGGISFLGSCVAPCVRE